MLIALKFILLVFSVFSFGFISLSQLCKIKSLILLIPLSVSFGVSGFIFICHILSFFTGPQAASLITPFVLLFAGGIVLLLKLKSFNRI